MDPTTIENCMSAALFAASCLVTKSLSDETSDLLKRAADLREDYELWMHMQFAAETEMRKDCLDEN